MHISLGMQTRLQSENDQMKQPCIARPLSGFEKENILVHIRIIQVKYSAKINNEQYHNADFFANAHLKTINMETEQFQCFINII